MGMTNKDYDVDAILQKVLHRTDKPDPALLDKIKKLEYVKETKMPHFKRSFKIAIAACMLLIITSATVFAATRLLTPREVAYQLGDQSLSAAFASDTAININKTVVSGGYRFSILSIVSGLDISDTLLYSEGLSHDRSYLIIAIENEDGSPMLTFDDDDIPQFYVSPYIRGFKPWQVNLHTLEGGHKEMIIDGVRYRIVDMENIKVFAEHGIYIGINTGWLFDSEAFIFNADPWELRVNPEFDGVSVVFELPVDLSLADPVRAAEILDANPFLQAPPQADDDFVCQVEVDEDGYHIEINPADDAPGFSDSLD